jgi:hypothetical protein
VQCTAQVQAWAVPIPGHFHKAEAAHLVAAADLDGALLAGSLQSFLQVMGC